MKVLLTGHDGFIGSHLGPALEARGHHVGRPKLDLFEWRSIEDAVRADNYEVVVHLAGLSNVPKCETDPDAAYRTNLNGTALLLEALSKHARATRLVFASTAQVYAAPTGDEITRGVVFDESRHIEPQTLYARTKRAAEALVMDASRKHAVLRLFNHTHRTQSPDFFLPHLYRTLCSGATEVPVGNLDVQRDIGAITDLVSALSLAVERDLAGVFNLCSGHGKHLGRLAATLAAQMRIDARFVVEAARMRAGEPRAIVGSHAKFTAATGWVPSVANENELVAAFLAG